MDNGIKNNGRIYAIDALRGFAISAILIIHSSNHFLYPSGPVSTPEWLANIDSFLKSSVYFIFEGKAYSIFALLFGFTYAIQLNKRMKMGLDFKYRMLWRMFLLTLFGALNAAFFAGGDPLIFYALCMIPVIFIRHKSNLTILLFGIFFLLQPFEWLNNYLHIIGNNHLAYYGNVIDSLNSGNFINIVKTNITSGIKGCLLWALETGRLSQTIGLFCFGILAYRIKYFSKNISFYKKVTVYCFVTSVILYYIVYITDNAIIHLYYNLSFSFFIINIFLYVYYKTENVTFWNNFIIYGKMSLTNFIGQSIICTSIFYSWGLHIGVIVGPTLSILIAFFICNIQIKLSNLWLKKHKQGPLEYLWHKMTWI